MNRCILLLIQWCFFGALWSCSSGNNDAKIMSHEGAKSNAEIALHYDASTLSGNVGKVVGTKREVTATGKPGHLVFGPYATNWPSGAVTAVFNLTIDVVNDSADPVALLDIFDATNGQVVAQRQLQRKSFQGNFIYQDFELPFSMEGRVGHKMESRVFVYGNSYVSVSYVRIASATLNYAANTLSGNVGKVSGTKREVTATGKPGHLVFGPYATNWPSGAVTAVFNLTIDVVNDSADPVALLDIFDATNGQVVAQRQLQRKSFQGNFIYQDFELPFSMEGRVGHKMESRVFVYGNSYVSVSYVRIASAAAQQASQNAGSSQISLSTFSSQTFSYNGSDLQGGNLGKTSGTERVIAAAPQNVGYFAFGPYADWKEGDAKATFQLSLDVVDTNDDHVLTIDVNDSTSNNILASKPLSRKDFGENGVAQDFVLYFSTKGRGGHRFETRVHTQGVSYIALHKVTVEIDQQATGLPKIVNHSDSSSAHVESLARAAIAGLGFGASAEGPTGNDIFYFGKWYVAWIDQTGFVGKMNALWQLNGGVGDSLSFLLQKDGRPLNMLIPGEAGNGDWGGSYTGAEHYELPSPVKEPNRTCLGDVCNWFAYNEAPPLKAKTPGVNIDWWAACNSVKPGFSKLFRPISINQGADFLELWYEDSLVKMADNTFPRTGNDCGLDYLFPDQRRRPIFLQTGFRFYKDSSHVDRHYRYRNASASTFAPSGSLILGTVITDLNRKIPEKAFYNYFRWTNGLNNDSAANYPNTSHGFPPRQFLPLISGWPTRDTVIGWGQTSYVASTQPRLLPGGSIGLSNSDMGNSTKQEDIGTCICYVHGGFEMGGGVLSGPTGAVPLSPRSTSIKNTRRIWLPNSDSFLPEWQ